MPVDPAAGTRKAPLPGRDALGQIVREEWTRWAALNLPWLPVAAPWDSVADVDREPNRRLGEHIYRVMAEGDTLTPAPSREDLGKVVHEALMRLAAESTMPREPPWEKLPDGSRERDRRIGERFLRLFAGALERVQ